LNTFYIDGKMLLDVDKENSILGGSRMSKTYRPWNPHQQWLLPPSVHDWLPENDLVYFILDTLNELDISAITKKYEQEERGHPPYNPRMMVALLFYAYCRGVFSSRKIMQACEERLTFRVIVGDDIPNFRTISDFRKLHLKNWRDYSFRYYNCARRLVW